MVQGNCITLEKSRLVFTAISIIFLRPIPGFSGKLRKVYSLIQREFPQQSAIFSQNKSATPRSIIQ
ncbi:MAG: hypothetical protein CMF59_16915 [Leptospiraceae bacterium]|nr:hypothetical protein [Leptospiraceae bacterium]